MTKQPQEDATTHWLRTGEVSTITPLARLSMALTSLCKSIEDNAGYNLGELSVLWAAKDHHKIKAYNPQLAPEDIIAIGLRKLYKERPQAVADLLETLLGWRLYRNIHDSHKIAWGRPPKHLGGSGQYWTWKADEADFKFAVQAMMKIRKES